MTSTRRARERTMTLQFINALLTYFMMLTSGSYAPVHSAKMPPFSATVIVMPTEESGNSSGLRVNSNSPIFYC